MSECLDCGFLDWKELASVFAACFPGTPAADISYQLRNCRHGIRLLRIDGRIAGFSINHDGKGPGLAWLAHIGVAPAFRARKLGRVVLEDYERASVARGYSRVELAVAKDNAVAIAMYEACGYSRIPREGESHTYVKELPAGEGAVPPSPTPGPLSRAISMVLYTLLVGA